MEKNKEIINIAAPDSEPEVETQDIREKLQLVELDLRKEELESNRQDREERKRFADKIFKLLSVYLAITMLILSLCAVESVGFNLHDRSYKL